MSEEQQEDLIDGINQNASAALLYCNAIVPGEEGLIAKEAFRQAIEKHQTRTLFVFYRTDLGDILIRHLAEDEIEQALIRPWMQTSQEQAQLAKLRWERYPTGTHPHEILWSKMFAQAPARTPSQDTEPSQQPPAKVRSQDTELNAATPQRAIQVSPTQP